MRGNGNSGCGIPSEESFVSRRRTSDSKPTEGIVRSSVNSGRRSERLLRGEAESKTEAKIQNRSLGKFAYKHTRSRVHFDSKDFDQPNIRKKGDGEFATIICLKCMSSEGDGLAPTIMPLLFK
jgi:hypothetical protein